MILFSQNYPHKHIKILKSSFLIKITLFSSFSTLVYIYTTLN